MDLQRRNWEVVQRRLIVAKTSGLGRQACLGRDSTHNSSLEKRRIGWKVKSLYRQALRRRAVRGKFDSGWALFAICVA